MKKILSICLLALVLCLLWSAADTPAFAEFGDYCLYLNDNYEGGNGAIIRNVSSSILPSRSRAGHTFQGWAMTQFGFVRYSAGDTVTLNGDLTLYAVWDGYFTEDDYSYAVWEGGAVVNGYSGTGGDIVIPERLGGSLVTAIEDSAFYGCKGLTGVTIPSGVTHIGDFAFCDCTGLKSATIQPGVTSIGNHMFQSCKGLASVTIPGSVTSIGDSAFYSCSGLTQITIPDSVTGIGDSAFYSCSGLTGVTIPSGVTRIGDRAFQYCTGLTSVTIQPGVTSIGNAMFQFCTGLTNVTIPDSVTSIGEKAFQYCSKLTQITIPDSVTGIGTSAFGYCSGLTEITIPDSVTSIGESAFTQCGKLSTIYFRGTGAQWDSIPKPADWNRYCPNDQTVICNARCVARILILPSGAGTATGAGAHEPGDSVTLSATANSGWRFAQWRAVSGNVTIADDRFTAPDGDVTIQAVFEPVYAIASDDAAVALREVGWLDWEIAAEAAEGETLEFQLADGAAPAEGYYFTGEFAVNDVSLGSITDETGLFSWPVAETTMPAEAISIAAVQAPRESVTLDFSQSAALTMPYMALVQLSNGEDSAALFTVDEDWNESVDLNGSGTPDLSVTEPDYVTTADYTLTLLPGADAAGGFAFSFDGPTDRYGVISFVLPFGVPDFILPAGIGVVEANAFEGIAASIAEVPDGCASIGDHAFKDCPNLTQIRIPADCQLGADVFDGCALVYVFGAVGSSAESYCRDHDNCIFVMNAKD